MSLRAELSSRKRKVASRSASGNGSQPLAETPEFSEEV
jgi:hypothetical protein